MDKLIENYPGFEFEDLKVESYQSSYATSIETDPSQEEIINSLTKHHSRIIQGPPGTGKSQSLTATIVNALENNAKCLVVCEKKTALEVIQNNLKEVGLEDLCVVIDDVNRDRKTVIDKVRSRNEQLKNIYLSRNNKYTEYHNYLKEYEELKQEINKRHKNVLKKFFGDDNWKNVISRYIQFYKKYKDNPLEQLNPEVLNYEFNEYHELLNKINEGKYLFKGVQHSYHQLNELNEHYFENSFNSGLKYELEKQFKLLHQESTKLYQFIHTSIQNYGGRFNKTSKFDDALTISLSFFSKKFTRVKLSRKKAKTKYLELIGLNNKINAFYFKFPDWEFISTYKEILPILQDYISKIKNILEYFNWYQEFHEFKYFYGKLSGNDKYVFDVLCKADPDDWSGVFQHWYLKNLLILNEVKHSPFHKNNYLLDKLADLYQQIKNIQFNKILNIWYNKQEESTNNFQYKVGNINSLYNYKKNKAYGRKNSLRKIVHLDFDLFSNYFPVILVNPVVASSIFPLKEGIFDLVIFDEASQLRLEDTYSSYIRGKFKIISGDVHQMPPSNYFGQDINIQDDDSDTDEEIILDDTVELAEKESLLDYTSHLEYPKSFLDFHYRSRHPFLIDFSNHAFYGSRLQPKPAKYQFKPIRFIEVNGLYENRTNPDEAEKVIEILELAIKPQANGEFPTVGIATFNMDQRNLIQQKIFDRCYLSKNFASKYEKLKSGGLFVKNLENIQGDERDIIIISTTFGLNAEGKFRQNFGPLSQLKGYKLLNVIITRAKHRVYLCTSIPSEYYLNYHSDINLKGNNGKGVLYAYLAYAKAVEDEDEELRHNILHELSLQCPEKRNNYHHNTIESPFEQEVYEYLIDHIDPQRIEMQYALGGFKLDFIIRSVKTGKPYLAIECDGAAYHATEEAYRYDLYRQKLIEKEFNLKFYRIWSTNWWYDPISETKKLVDHIIRLDKYDDGSSLANLLDKIEFADDLLNKVFEPTKSIEREEPKEKSTVDEKEVVIAKKTSESVTETKEKSATKYPVIGNQSIVKLREELTGKELKLKFTSEKNKSNLNTSPKIVYDGAPLARSCMGKKVGDKFKIDGLDVYYEILSIE